MQHYLRTTLDKQDDKMRLMNAKLDVFIFRFIIESKLMSGKLEDYRHKNAASESIKYSNNT